MAVASATIDFPHSYNHLEKKMRSILLLLLGIPIPIVILIALFLR